MPETTEVNEVVETSEPSGVEGSIQEPKGLKQSSDFIENPVPDSQDGAKPEEAYDFDFEYLKTSKSKGEEKKEEQPQVTKEKDIPVPLKEGQEIQVTLTDSPVLDTKEKSTEAKIDKAELTALQSVKDKEIQTLTDRLAAKEAELRVLEQTKLALDEIKKEPLAFLYKQIPELAKKVDLSTYVAEKMTKEFGDGFEYDASEAFRPGTPSYQYRLREEELRSELRQQQYTAQAEEERTTREREVLLSTSKAKVMTRYGLSEEQFQREIHDYSKSLVFDYEVVARLRFADDIIKAAVAKALKNGKEFATTGAPPAVGATAGGTAEEESSAGYKEFNSEFGD